MPRALKRGAWAARRKRYSPQERPSRGDQPISAWPSRRGKAKYSRSARVRTVSVHKRSFDARQDGFLRHAGLHRGRDPRHRPLFFSTCLWYRPNSGPPGRRRRTSCPGRHAPGGRHDDLLEPLAASPATQKARLIGGGRCASAGRRSRGLAIDAHASSQPSICLP